MWQRSVIGIFTHRPDLTSHVWHFHWQPTWIYPPSHVKKITDVRITSFFYTLGTRTIRVSDNSAQTISSHDKTIIIKFWYVAWYLNIMKYALLSIKRSSNTCADPELFFLGGGGGYFSLSGVGGGGF